MTEQEKYYKALNEKRELQSEFAASLLMWLIFIPPIIFLIFWIIKLFIFLIK